MVLKGQQHPIAMYVKFIFKEGFKLRVAPTPTIPQSGVKVKMFPNSSLSREENFKRLSPSLFLVLFSRFQWFQMVCAPGCDSRGEAAHSCTGAATHPGLLEGPAPTQTVFYESRI